MSPAAGPLRQNGMSSFGSFAAANHGVVVAKPSVSDSHRRAGLKPFQASMFSEGFALPEALRCNASANAPKGSTVFRDESKGIVCYRTPTGEITCEGIDEGPHFHPPSQYLRFQIPQHLTSAKSREDEAYVNGAGI
ncbi:hypothetical protein O6H91_02G121100 [Diphasiastrum complanatum]|uniref:Uncharacterized protein n=1 Tax=Diphasiastrum complanatum TaxID=34168 RepID=A0ACC2EJQ5_DIPCM|nr:hypothetical protein O6H91_02G121100 [Diphasiastrum complanatum]